jgi:hypothetical protein
VGGGSGLWDAPECGSCGRQHVSTRVVHDYATDKLPMVSSPSLEPTLSIAAAIWRIIRALVVGVGVIATIGTQANAQVPPMGPPPPARASQNKASPAPEAAVEPAWARGVSAQAKDDAQRLLEQGNALFLRGDFRAALATYQDALRAWDHPAIRFNIGRTLIQLDRTAEAFDNLELALSHGRGALEEHVHAEAQGYLKLLRGQVSELELRCTQEGVEVSIDGRKLLSCPRVQKVRLAPGPHVVVGSRAGFIPQTLDVVLAPGAAASAQVHLLSVQEATRVQRRWQLWKPWSLVGGGVALGSVSAILGWKARSHNEQYGKDIALLCNEGPCRESELPQATRDLAWRAERESRTAIVLGSLAGVATSAGLVLVLMNQPRPVPASELPDRHALSLAPVVSAGLVGARLSGSFRGL